MTDLIERLRARHTVRDEFSTCHPLCNPDGPEAADAIQSRDEEIAALKLDVASLNSVMRQKKKEIARLRASLEIHGEHETLCPAFAEPKDKCECGLRAALEKRA